MTDRRTRNDPTLQAELEAERQRQAQEDKPGDDLALQVRPTGRILELLETIASRLRPEAEQESRATILPVVPQDGRQSIGAGSSFSFTLEDLPNVAGLIFDVPETVEATVRRDGNALIGISDGQGRSGSLELPGDQVAAWSSVSIAGTNNASQAQDVGLWAAVIYEGAPL